MYPSAEMHNALLTHMKENNASFFSTLDLKKPRAEREHVDPAAALLTPEQRHDVLEGDVSLKAIAKRILSGKTKST